MNPFANDLLNNFMIEQSLKPAAYSQTTNGDGIDCKDCEGPMTALLNFGVCTDANYLASVEESVDNSTFTAITPIDGAFVTVTSVADELEQVVQFKRSKRYVRIVLTETSAGSTGVVACGTLLGRKKNV